MSVEDSDALGFVQLDTGQSALLRRGTEEPSVGKPEASGGVIFKDEADMPALEELLAAHRVLFAVLERPTPSSDPSEAARVGVDPAKDASAGAAPFRRVRTFCAVGVATAVTTTGLVFLVAAGSTSFRPNPYLGLLLLLGGVVLLLTVNAALRTSGWLDDEDDTSGAR